MTRRMIVLSWFPQLTSEQIQDMFDSHPDDNTDFSFERNKKVRARWPS